MLNYSIDKSIDSKKVYQNIIDNKQNIAEKDCLILCKNDVFEDYDLYENNKNDLGVLVPDTRINADSKKVLIGEYNKKPAALRNALDKVGDNMPMGLSGKCVYCQISEPNTYDHYLNKDKFPEYSLYIPNLLPCCSWCNSYKGETPSIDINGVHNFIHSIYDKIPTEELLFYDSVMEQGKPKLDKIRLELNDSSGEIYAILRRQYERIQLVKRLTKQYPSDIANILIDFKGKSLSELEVINILSTKLDMTKELFGINHRNTAIYRGLLNNNEIVTYLASC